MKKLNYRRSLSLCICSLLFNIIVMPAYAASEQELSIKGEHYQIPAVLTLPDLKSEKPLPVVIMLHGTASNKNEVGNLFKRLAEKLAKQNVASIRFDFAGSGESIVDYKVYDLKSAVNDVINVHQYIQQQKQLEHKSIHLLGFSQGGLIAQLASVNSALPVTSMVTWSSVAGDGIGSFQPFFDQYEQESIDNGFAAIKYPWLNKPLNFSHQWFEQIRNNTSLTQLIAYQGALLAIAGDADKTVPWQNSLSLIKGAKQAQTSLYLIKNANHIFNVLAENSAELNSDQSLAEELLAITAHYFIKQTKQ